MKKNYRPLTYLACPYSHPNPETREQRFKLCTLAAAQYMRMHPRANVFSPITHSHPLHDIAGMAGNWKFWKRVDTQYLRISRRLVVLMIPGWRESVGVQAEIKIARKLKLPISYVEFK